MACCATLLLPGSLHAQDGNANKSKLKFRPPGSKSVSSSSGQSRIRLSSDRAPIAKREAQPKPAKPTPLAVAQAQRAAAQESTDSTVVTAAFQSSQDRYADRYADDDSPRVAGDHFSNDDFAGDDFFGNTFDDEGTLPPPPRIFGAQDPMQPGDQQPGVQNPPPAIPQGQQDPLPFHCPTKEEMGIMGLNAISLNIAPSDEVPDECPLFDEPWVPRDWAYVDFFWKASAICHKPLYFEDVALERYGHSHGMFVQPFVSGAHFFAAIPILPYKMGLQHPHECMYPLGYYRPGSCAPKLMYPLPLSWRGALYQGAASTGMVFLIP